jgi:carbamate kinase
VAGELATEKGWTFRQDGDAWRRVVPSPEPRQVVEVEPIRWLIDRGSVVVCAGGGGIPTMHSAGAGPLAGVEAVIDKDFASELLAENIGAELFVMATDVDGVYLDFGTPQQHKLADVTPGELARHEFPAGSMGPKVRGGDPLREQHRGPGGYRLARRHRRHPDRRRRHNIATRTGSRVAAAAPVAGGG